MMAETGNAFFHGLHAASLGESAAVYPRAQLDALKAALKAVTSNVQAKGAAASAILFSRNARAEIVPSWTWSTDAWRNGSVTRLTEGETGLANSVTQLLGNLPDNAAVDPGSWATLYSKILYLYGLVFIEAGMFPASARGVIDKLQSLVVTEAQALPGRIAALPGAVAKGVVAVVTDVVNPIVKAGGDIASGTAWAIIKSFWPFLLGGVVVLGGTIWLLSKAARAMPAGAIDLLPGGAAVKTAARMLQGSPRGRGRRGRGMGDTVLLGEVRFHPQRRGRRA